MTQPEQLSGLLSAQCRSCGASVILGPADRCATCVCGCLVRRTDANQETTR